MFSPTWQTPVSAVTTLATQVVVASRDAAVRQMIEMALQSDGYKPQLYADGELALEALLSGTCAAAVLDVHLPTVDGLAICQRVRASPLVASVPIILLLTHEDTLLWHANSHRLRINGVLYMPFRIHEILMAVAVAMQREILSPCGSG
jgi:DNA-binding response OmpR family regulator